MIENLGAEHLGGGVGAIAAIWFTIDKIKKTVEKNRSEIDEQMKKDIEHTKDIAEIKAKLDKVEKEVDDIHKKISERSSDGRKEREELQEKLIARVEGGEAKVEQKLEKIAECLLEIKTQIAYWMGGDVQSANNMNKKPQEWTPPSNTTGR